MKYILLFSTLLSFIFPAQVTAGEKPKQTTIETVFRAMTMHPDEYEIGIDVIRIPAEIVRQCQDKKIRITGIRLPSPATDSTGAPAKTRMSMDESRTLPDGPTFQVTTITMWNEKKKHWDLVYRP